MTRPCNQERCDRLTSIYRRLETLSGLVAELERSKGASSDIVIAIKGSYHTGIRPIMKQLDAMAIELIGRTDTCCPELARFLTTPTAQAAAAGNAEQLPISKIFTDPKRFQPRLDLNETKIQAIIDNFDPQKLTPVVVWRDPNDDRLYLLEGHHRLEALRRRGHSTILATIFRGTPQEAWEQAWTSNVRGRPQTAIENARLFREYRTRQGMSEKMIRSKCDEILGKNCNTSYMLSFLPDEAKVLQDAQSFERDTESYRDLETMARWISAIAQKYTAGASSQLTKQHIDEIYDWLKVNFKTQGRRIPSVMVFEEYIGRLLALRFPLGAVDDKPLNLDNLRGRTDGERDHDARLIEADKAVRDAFEDIRRYSADYAKAVEQALTDDRELPSETAYAAGMKKRNDVLTMAQRELLQLRAKSQAVRESSEAQAALFGLDRSVHEGKCNCE